jgi:hypothetical protein
MSDEGGLQVDPRLVFTRADHELALAVGRWQVENQKLVDLFPSAEVLTSSDGRYRVRFTIKSHFGNSWHLFLEIGDNYPNERPEVKTNGWEIVHQIDDDGFNHCYGSNTPCVQDPAQWSKDMSVVLTIFKTAKWVDKYEIWLNSGSPGHRRWPGAQHVF